MLIKNFSSLATSPLRQAILEVVESGLEAVQPEKILEDLRLEKDALILPDGSSHVLSTHQRVFLLGFGKGSASISQIIESRLGDRLTRGWVIDLVPKTFSKISETIGTHPLPSEANVNFTRQALQQLNNLTAKDLVIVVVSGGGSALLTDPAISISRLIEINQGLLKSGASIFEMNTIRKHLDSVKGGGLAKTLYPATVVSLIFSDVPGNDLTTIASGPTVKDPTSIADAVKVAEKYHLTPISPSDFTETPKEDKCFANVSNVIVLSNLTALVAMKSKADELGYVAEIYSDKLQGEARDVGRLLIEKTPPKTALLAGGETTVTVKGKGLGGRNQELVLSTLSGLDINTAIASVGSDGWDNSPAAGAMGDSTTLKKAQELGLDTQSFLDNNDSYTFFEKVGDGIETGKLASNVSDLIVVFRDG